MAGTIEFVKNVIFIVGLGATLFSIGLFVWAIISWLIGIYPLFLRLGVARWSRKISIVGSDEIFNSLKSDLLDTGIFREKNIIKITSRTLAKIKDSGLILVHYQSFSEDEIKRILSYKKSISGLIVYFPELSPQSRISDEMMKLINNEQFSITVNFRGRLINDVVSMLLSTSYEKK